MLRSTGAQPPPCEPLTSVEMLVDTDSGIMVWVVNACNSKARDLSRLLDLPGVKTSDNPWHVRPVVASKQTIKDCVDDWNYVGEPNQTPATVRKCIMQRETEADPKTPQQHVIQTYTVGDGGDPSPAIRLPFTVSLEDITITPLLYPATLTLIAPQRQIDDDACAVLQVTKSDVRIKGMVLDISPCATEAQDALFPQTLLSHTALALTGDKLSNITVTDTVVIGGDWTAFIAPTVDNEQYSVKSGLSVDARDIVMQITHVGYGGVFPPGIIMASAVEKLRLKLLPTKTDDNKDGLLTTYAVLLYKTFPGALDDEITVSPAQVRVRDISAYAYVPAANSNIPSIRAAWECTRALVEFDGDLSQFYLWNKHDRSASPGLIAAGVILGIGLAIASIIVFYVATNHIFEHMSTHTAPPSEDE